MGLQKLMVSLRLLYKIWFQTLCISTCRKRRAVTLLSHGSAASLVHQYQVAILKKMSFYRPEIK